MSFNGSATIFGPPTPTMPGSLLSRDVTELTLCNVECMTMIPHPTRQNCRTAFEAAPWMLHNTY